MGILEKKPYLLILLKEKSFKLEKKIKEKNHIKWRLKLKAF